MGIIPTSQPCFVCKKHIAKFRGWCFDSKVSNVGWTNPKDPDMSWERDLPYNPIVRMGLRPSILLDREGFGFLGKLATLQKNGVFLLSRPWKRLINLLYIHLPWEPTHNLHFYGLSSYNPYFVAEKNPSFCMDTWGICVIKIPLAVQNIPTNPSWSLLRGSTEMPRLNLRCY